MGPHFTTVFDIAQKPPNWEIVGPCIVCFGLVLGWLLWEWKHEKRFKYMMVAAAFAFILFAVGFGVYKDSTYGIAEAQESLKRGRVSTIEGRVTDFVPMPFEGHSMEQFTVGGARFSYSDYLVVPCFNRTSSHGGPIRAGIWVRLSYRGGCILKIEVWQDEESKN